MREKVAFYDLITGNGRATMWDTNPDFPGHKLGNAVLCLGNLTHSKWRSECTYRTPLAWSSHCGCNGSLEE